MRRARRCVAVRSAWSTLTCSRDAKLRAPPGRGHEQLSAKRRRRARPRGVVTVVPVTSNLARVYPFQVALPAEQTGLRMDSKAQAEQVRSVSVERIGPPLGFVPAHLMAQLDDALRLHLQI